MVHVDFDCPACGTTLSNCSYWLGPISTCWECEAKLTVTLPAGYRWENVRVPDCQACGAKQAGWRDRHESHTGEGWCDECRERITGYPDDHWGEPDYDVETPGSPDEVCVRVLVEELQKMTEEILERAKALDSEGLLIGELLDQLSERYRLAWEESTAEALDLVVHRLWQDRQARKKPDPKGKFDRAGRWYPDGAEERCSCCSKIAGPSRVWPYSLLTHCRTRPHIKRLAEEHPEAFERLTGHVREEYVPLTEILMNSELEELGLALE